MNEERELQDLLGRAICFAASNHIDQTLWNKDPYILHPLAVMFKFEPHQLKERILAVLHDVAEDCEMTVDEIDAVLNIGEELSDALECLTHKEDESYGDYCRRIMTNVLSSRVKVKDLEHNMDVTRNRTPLKEKDTKRIMKYHTWWVRLTEHLQSVEE